MMMTKNDINISNGLSLLRLLLAIPFWFLLSAFQQPDIKLWLIIVAIIGVFTDWADGFFARKLNQVTEIGKIIDPLADKVCMTVLVYKLYIVGKIPAALLLILIGRDFIIFISGIFLTKYLGKVLPSNFLGKVTVTAIAFYIFMIFFEVRESHIVFISTYYGIVGLAILSLIAYAIRAIEFIQKKKHEHL